MGYLLEIELEKADTDATLFCGSLRAEKPVLCECPNCGELMFPVFTVHRSLPGLPDITIYDKDGFVTFDVCPSCSHSLENYFVRHEGNARVASGGYSDHSGPSNKIDHPFGARAVKVTPVADADWGTAEFSDKYFRRALLNGVMHQLGGKKMKRERVPLERCLCCSNAQLTYLGTIDYDDFNVPLYENAEPRALIIGDMDSLNVMACEQCGALNYGLTVG